MQWYELEKTKILNIRPALYLAYKKLQAGKSGNKTWDLHQTLSIIKPSYYHKLCQRLVTSYTQSVYHLWPCTLWLLDPCCSPLGSHRWGCRSCEDTADHTYLSPDTRRPLDERTDTSKGVSRTVLKIRRHAVTITCTQAKINYNDYKKHYKHLLYFGSGPQSL